MTTVNATEVIDNVRELWAESVIEQHRFPTEEDRFLARYESDYPSLMPSSDDLDELGFDIIGLAVALDAGLDAVWFGKAYRLLDIAEFNIALVAHAAGLDIALYNEGLSHLADMVDERD